MSVATVITQGFGSFGTVALVVRDGYAASAAAATSLVGRRHRPRRIWVSPIGLQEPTRELVTKEQAYIAQMLLEAEAEDILAEIKVLGSAESVASAAQAKRLTKMMDRLQARLEDLAEDESAAMMLLMQ